MTKNKKNGTFSKGVILSIILANIIFTATVLWVFLKTSAEPTTLVVSWFSFTTVELWSLASIKKTKENNRNGGNSDG